jgi:hypothetical protein
MNSQYARLHEETVTEAMIAGQRVPYDACSSNTLESAKEFYGRAFEYIGSGYVLFIDGTRNEFPELHHFFRRADKQDFTTTDI